MTKAPPHLVELLFALHSHCFIFVAGHCMCIRLLALHTSLSAGVAMQHDLAACGLHG